MKRILSVLLAVLMVLSTTVMAAPAPASTYESVQESTDDGSNATGELEAVKTVKTGINMLTGTTAPLTGETTTNDALKALTSPNYDATLTVSDDPLDVHGKVIEWYFPAPLGGNYPSMDFAFGGKLNELVGHTYVLFAFDYAKVVNGITETNYTPNTNFWIMNSTTGGGDIARSVGATQNAGWKHFSEIIDMTNGGTTTTKEPTSFKFEAEIKSTNTIPTSIYLDNLLVVPAYKFTFLSEDGSEVLATKYEALDESGNVITSYKPEAGIYGSSYVPSWSLTKGGEAVESIDITKDSYTLYAVGSTPVVTIEQEGDLTDIGEKAKLIPIIDARISDIITAVKGVWTVEDESIISLVKNNDGTATITALAEGSTKVTFAVGDTKADYEVSVVLPYELEVDELEAGAILSNFNPASYTAMVVNLAGSAEGDVFELYFQIDDNEMGTIEVEATTTENRDYLVDLTEIAEWTEGNTLILQTSAGDTTVNSIKLYSVFKDTYEYVINPASALLTTPGEELDITVDFKAALEGYYTGEYTLEVTDPDDVASVKLYEDGTAKIRAKVATGVVSVKATSIEKPEYSVTKNIYVNVDSSKYGMFFDFLEAETPADANLKACGGDEGHTAVTIVDGVLHLDRPTTVDGNGGFEPYNITISEDAAKKYLVVKADDSLTSIKFYYKWDSNPHAEANTVSLSSAGSVKSDNGDGTITVVLPLANVPDTAEKITGFMGTIDKQTTADIHYFYLTSEKPEIKAAEAIAYTWDFTTNTFTASQNQGLAKFNGETMWATVAMAMINGAKVNVQANPATLSDGTEIYRLQTEKGTHGSLSPKTYPSGLVLSDYPYFWFKYRSNGTANANLYLMDTDKGGSESGYDNRLVSFPASEDWTTKVVYLPDLGYSASLNTALSHIMLPYRGETVLTNVQSDSEGYYVPKTGYEYSSQTWIEFDEITIANYNPFAYDEEEETLPLEMAVTLSASSNTITEDGGSVVITPSVYANQEISTEEVTFSITGGCASMTKNNDGTVTINAISNGTAVITAVAVEDPSFSGSIEITITGQRNKIAAYDFSYLCIGNSYSQHGGTEQFAIWCAPGEPLRGMAASKPELDYYSRIQYHLTTGLNGTMKAKRIGGASLENAGELTATATTIEQITANMKNDAAYKSIKEYLLTEKPNVITVQLSENFQSATSEVQDNFYEVLYGMINESRPVNSVVVCITPFGSGSRNDAIEKYAAKYGFYVADMAYIADYSKVDSSKRYYTHPETGKVYDRGTTGWKYNPYLAWEPYAAYDDQLSDGTGKYVTDFRSHPGDLGMEEIALRVFEQFEATVPSFLEAEYIYVPDSIEITGGDEITELAGTLQLTAVATPDDSATDVIWSVDDETYATISEDGLLTAKVNGEVVVTAKSAYDSSVVATKTITISGQYDVYTLTYKAGTTDEVTGIPAADNFARGEYTLSELVPSRNGYKFLGWSLTEDGEAVTVVDVTENTDVYALWTLAEGWHFDEDGNYEGITFGGFNVKVENGVGTVVSYGEGVSISDATLLLDSDNYSKFNTTMSIGSAEEDFDLVLELTTTEGKKTYSADVTAVGEQKVYSFDISDAEGTITGFALKPTALECQADVDWIEFERCALNKDAEVDVVNVLDEYTVDANGYVFTIGTLNAPEGTVTTLENGTFAIGEIIGEGTVNVNGGLIIDGDNVPDGYIAIDVGSKEAETNVRYAEVDGMQYEFAGNVYGMIITGDEAKLVQIVEKENAKAVLTVKTEYYYVTSEGATALNALANGVNNVDEVSLRVKDPVGVRFKAGIVASVREEATAFEVTEYGYVIALERDLVNAGQQLTLDFAKSVSGSAYVKAEDIDVIHENDGSTIFFTGVLYGIPENSYGVKLVSKTFTKLTVNGKEFTVYGEPMTASAYQIAKQLENNTELDEGAMEMVNNIIDKAENGKDLGFDYGDL